MNEGRSTEIKLIILTEVYTQVTSFTQTLMMLKEIAQFKILNTKYIHISRLRVECIKILQTLFIAEFVN